MSAQSITVACRVRPHNAREKKYQSKLVIGMPDMNTVEIFDPKRSETNLIPPRKFQFDYCLWTYDSPDDDPDKFVDQKRTYECIGAPLLENSLKGFNGCLFAYGQTGSGKSFTMLGSDSDPGVIPRLCQSLFNKAAEISDTTSIAVDCSFLEIYNEQVKDLLNPAGIDKVLKVRQHPKLGVFVEGLKKMVARSAEDIAKLLDDGTQVRTIASTAMNATSSRSHAILTLSIRVKTSETETMSVLNLVDLAGSERQASTGAEGQTLKEGANINKSLTVLGMCLSRLAEASDSGKGKSSAGHIPFRDSQLTWLLNDSLGGNSKTTMLAALSPADINYEETLSTLRFASITRKIKMVVKINEDPQQKIIRELREQIQQIKEEIRALAEGRVITRQPAANAEDGDDPDYDPMAVDTLPSMDLDIRRAQLLEELEQNTNLMTEWTMTAEQRAEQDAREREAHAKHMAELQKGSRGAGSSIEESCPKLLVLNEDLRMLRGADGNPLALVHTMLKPPPISADDVDSNNSASVTASSSAANSPNAAAAAAQQRGGSGGAPQRRSRSRSFATSKKQGADENPPAAFSVLGPQTEDSGGIVPWLRLPAASGLSPTMHLDFVVDFVEHTISLEFEDTHKSSGDVVFVNGKPVRFLGRDGKPPSSGPITVALQHNDRVIVGQVIFRVFAPIAWRLAELAGGEEETFQEEATDTAHLELLEQFDRRGIEEDAFEALVHDIWGDDAEGAGDSTKPGDATHDGHVMSPVPRSLAGAAGKAGASSNDDLDLLSNSALAASVAELRSSLTQLTNEARWARADAEEQLVQQYPRDVRRDLRAQDVQDSLAFDGGFALRERQDYIEERQREQAEVQRKLKDLEAEGAKLKQAYEAQEREREEAARRAKEQADREAQEQVKKAEELAKQKLQTAAAAGSGAPLAVAGMKQTAQGKLAIARRVHEYEELRRELLLWKPAGPTDPRDRPTYTSLTEAISTGKNIPSYLDIRKQFSTEAAAAATGVCDDPTAEPTMRPRFEGQVFKNRIKTGFFSRSGLHPVTLLIVGSFLFYLEPGAGLANPTASQLKVNGFAYLVGCEVAVIADIDKKPALRVVSCAPRKHNQGKTDPHHGLEFAFVSIEQREQVQRAIEQVRLPAPDAEVASALAQLES